MALSLDSFLSLIKNKSPEGFLGIDIGSSSIKVVQLARKKGRAVLQTYGELALGPYAGLSVGQATKLPVDKVIEALKDVLREANVSTKKCALSIPMRSSMVSVFKMPSMKDKQLAQMVPIEARKYIPVPISEVTLDWFVIPTFDEIEGEEKPEEKKFIEALVVAIHNDVLVDFSSYVNGAGLSASFFEVEMFSTARSVLQPGDTGAIMIVDIGAGATKVYVTEQGVIRDSHTIARGSQNVTLNLATSLKVTNEYAEKLKRDIGHNNPEQDANIRQISDLVMQPILNEISSVLLNFQRKYNKDISKIVFIGGGAMLDGLVDKAKAKFGIETVLGNPFSKIDTPAFLAEVLKDTGLAFAPAAGLALRLLQENE